jgi:hypothetical protein
MHPLMVMRRVVATILSLVACGLLPVVTQAVTLQQLSLDEMTEQSTAIVYGKVLDSYAAPQGSMIYTHYRVQVLERWKGTSPAIVEVMVPGGAANGLRQTFAGVPDLAEGKSYVMFLWSGKSGAPQLIGLNQGLFDVTRDANGTLFASRPMSTEQMLDSTGRAVQDQPVRLDFRQFNTRVKATIAARTPKVP